MPGLRRSRGLVVCSRSGRGAPARCAARGLRRPRPGRGARGGGRRRRAQRAGLAHPGRLTLPLSVLTLGGAALVLNGGPRGDPAAISPAPASTAGSRHGGRSGLTMSRRRPPRCWRSTTTRPGTATSCAARRGAQGGSRRTSRAWCSSRSTAWRTRCSACACATATPRDGPLAARGTHRLSAGRPTGRRRPGACQAGLLHGDNDDMPAFRWWEKDRGTPIVTNHPRDAQELERRHSNGRGLLYEDGASRANILSGDASHSMLTMSTVLVAARAARARLRRLLRPPLRRHAHAALADRRLRPRAPRAARQVRDDVQPRIPRRACTRSCGPGRRWSSATCRSPPSSATCSAGRPVVYSTFLAYDEVAHHSGIERHDTLAVLPRSTARSAGCRRRPPSPAAVRARRARRPRPVAGRDVPQRYGDTLQDLVARGVRGRARRGAGRRRGRGLGLPRRGPDRGRGDQMAGRAVRRPRAAQRRRAVDARAAAAPRSSEGDELPEIVGDGLGLPGPGQLPARAGRVTLERLGELYRADRRAPRPPGHRLPARALERAGRGRPRRATGVHHLDEDAIEGDEPLAPFGPTPPRTCAVPTGSRTVPTSSSTAFYSPDTEEVAAFEELVGSHGGMGGSQSFPFVLFPGALRFPERAVVGAEQMHRRAAPLAGRARARRLPQGGGDHVRCRRRLPTRGR